MIIRMYYQKHTAVNDFVIINLQTFFCMALQYTDEDELGSMFTQFGNKND